MLLHVITQSSECAHIFINTVFALLFHYTYLQDLLVDVTKGRAAAGTKGSSSSAPGVVLRESRSGGVVVCGLEEVQVLDATDIFRILEKGIQQRRTAATLMNKVRIK
jgi:hypothetical protein